MKIFKGKRMSGRTKSAILLCLTLVLTVFFAIVGVTGMNLDGRGLYKLKPWLPSTDASR